MNAKKIIGREAECARLKECVESSSAELVIVYGRRRVGKTYLINNYFDNNFAFKITGRYNCSKEEQLEVFAGEYMRKTKQKERPVLKRWMDAFNLLRDYLESLDSRKRQVVFFDEMPWLDTQKSDFLSVFEWFWNDWASTRDNLIFIVCGSATSWMDEKIASNKGGLFNRETCKLFLKPFNLHETELFLMSKGISWSRYEIAECYMIMGGIPYYLDTLSRSTGLKQNIDRVFFSESGELRDEFQHLYATLFTNSPDYIRIVEILSRKNRGMTRKDLSEASGIPENGRLTTILRDLELSGFIRASRFYRKKRNDIIYSLSDYYTSFYFRYLGKRGNDEHQWSNSIDSPSKRAWSGYAFESLVRDHIREVKQRLGISGVLSEEYSWFKKGDETGPGAEIDLIIDRRDDTVNLCEIKYSTGEYVIDKSYDLTLRNKIEAFRMSERKSKSIQLTMITSFGVRRNMYSGIVQNEVVLDDLFAPCKVGLVFTCASAYTFPMEKIRLDEFLSYSYLSGVKAGEDGIFFTLSRAKKDKSGYESNFYMLKNGEPRALTSDGRAGWGTTWKGKLYFTAKRTAEETKDEEKSTIYALPLDGGEASGWLTVDGKLTKYDFVSDDTLVALFSVDRRLEGLGEDERRKKAEEIKGYEEIEQSPFYLNGEGFTCGRRTRLAVIKSGVTRFVFDDDYDTSSYTLSPGRTMLLCTGNVRKSPKPCLTTEVRRVNLSDLKWETILPEGELKTGRAWFLGDRIITAGSDMKRYGLNQNPDFYSLEGGKAVLLSKWGDSTWSSVGTDIRLKGGESFSVEGDRLYFTTTKGHSSNVYRINAGGEIEPVITEEGSVDCISVYNGNVYYAGLREQRLQELYRGSEKLTAFNDGVLEGKYVGVPEEIEYENDGISLTGWVLRPFGWESGKTYPAILDIHGGPKTVYGTVFMHEMQYWASEGFFVFWTNPRGSDGRGDGFADIRGKYGSVDYSDLMAFRDAVMEKYPSIDPGRVGVTGGSYGGFMSNWILGHTSSFRAIATQRSIYNWVSFYGTSDIGPYFATDQCGCTSDDISSMYHRSPMEAVRRNASTPTLILHSDKDYRCPVEQAYQLYTTLVDMGVETRFVLFHDESHELSRSGKPLNRIKRLDEITKWFRKFLC